MNAPTPIIFDPKLDEFRPVTQADVDLMSALVAAWGSLSEQFKLQAERVEQARKALKALS